PVVVAQAIPTPPPGKITSTPLPPVVAASPPPAPPSHLPPPAPTGADLAKQQVKVVAVRGDKQMYIQAGAFAANENARRLSAKLAPIAAARITTVKAGQQTMFRVRIGPIASVDQADSLLERVIHSGYPEARLVVD